MEDTPSEHIWLSNLDLLQSRSHLPSAYLYKPNGSSGFFETKVLKEALSKVLVPFYPVAGRLGKDEKGRLEIHCSSDKGVLFTEAEADSAMDELGDFLRDDVLRFLVPKVDYSNAIDSYPLLVLQVTTFTCGGVSLGVGWHHTLADGYSALHFTMSWSSISRGLPISIPPFHDRTVLRCRDPPAPVFPHIEYDEPPALYISPQDQKENQLGSSNYLETLKITADQLETLKAKVKSKDDKTKYSTYEILTAHIWRCACKARGLSDDQETKLYISVDGRTRFSPPLPSGFFGNVVFHATPIALCGEVASEPLVDTAGRVNKTIKRMDDEYLRSAIDYLEEIGDPTRVSERVMKTGGKCPNLKIVSWARMPFLEAHDFGWGKPISMRAANPSEGKGHIISCPSGDENLVLAICLGTHQMPAFKKLFYEF
ncbi:Anthranilate N-benzoyltransferase protein, putative [Ricinus communis]|uniref:Anthranilate N-benzoyltransferase protein, putative n=1 Tax=Ricinus communis TaxID=3988 RepID=B9STU4_RICCO|nr:Anthranilate N-benzoyltransferase protein, putative [Ricinus communis]|eukprot:XP_002529413.1 shikimate O-hydroxycinnamoyltransferase [Ricinus communis]